MLVLLAFAWRLLERLLPVANAYARSDSSNLQLGGVTSETREPLGPRAFDYQRPMPCVLFESSEFPTSVAEAGELMMIP